MRKGERQAWESHLAGGESRQRGDFQPRRHTTRQSTKDLEFKIQSAFIDRVRLVQQTADYPPELDLLYAVPNGGHRHVSVGVKMKREGVLRGVPDLHLPVARCGYHSLYLETKVPDGPLSKPQKEMKRRLEAAGNLVKVCYGPTELWRTMMAYLGEEL